jgi:hypothetical protein
VRPARGASLGALLAAAAAVAGGAAAPTASAEPSAAQAAFTKVLQDDAATTEDIKQALTRHDALVDPRSGFVDVTGDGRQDALALVTTGGALGAVALYVLSTHGQDAADQTTSLKVIFRLQRLRQATLRVNGSSLTVLEPIYPGGADLCCPTQLRERTYTFDAAHVTFRRVGDRRLPYR